MSVYYFRIGPPPPSQKEQLRLAREFWMKHPQIVSITPSSPK